MTKYLVFKNQPGSEQVNEPGTREEMASEIANVASRDRMPPNYYIAFPIEHPSTSLESLKELAKYSVEITDETAELWVNEINEMVQKAYQVDDAISEACSGMYQAMIQYNNLIQASNNLQVLTELSIKALDSMFEYFEVESSYEVPTKVEEIFSVEYFHHHHA